MDEQIERRATVAWEGGLDGQGLLTAESSEVLISMPVSWEARLTDVAGRTTPEELLAAAIATSYAMSLSTALEREGTAPERLEVTVSAELAGGSEPTRVGAVRVSQALRDDVPVQLTARLLEAEPR